MTSAELVPLTQAELVSWFKGDDIVEGDTSDEDLYAIALKVLTAEDSAAVLERDDVRKGEDLAGVTFTVLSLTWRKSTKGEDGKGRYALCRCVDTDGRPFIASFGATKVVLQLRKAEIEQWFPWSVEMTVSPTQSGNTVMELTAPTKSF